MKDFKLKLGLFFSKNPIFILIFSIILIIIIFSLAFYFQSHEIFWASKILLFLTFFIFFIGFIGFRYSDSHHNLLVALEEAKKIKDILSDNGRRVRKIDSLIEEAEKTGNPEKIISWLKKLRRLMECQKGSAKLWRKKKWELAEEREEEIREILKSL